MAELVAELVAPVEYPMPSRMTENGGNDDHAQRRTEHAIDQPAQHSECERQAYDFGQRSAHIEGHERGARMRAGELPCIVQQTAQAEAADCADDGADDQSPAQARRGEVADG